MNVQPDYDKILEPIADVTTSIETLLDGAFGRLMGDQREGLKHIYAAAWGLHTLLLDVVTNIGIDNMAKRSYLAQKFDEHIDPITQRAQSLLDGMDGPLSEEQFISVDFIRVTGDLLRRYADNLLLYSQLKNNLYHLNKQMVAIDSLFNPMEWSLTDDPVDLELLIPENMPKIKVDAYLISNVLLQLVDNAVNNTSQGNIRILVEDFYEHVTITVSDTGSGIPAPYQEQIFDPFFQINPNQLGLGIGLTLVREIIHLHDGTIDLSPNIQNGTNIVCTLPYD